MNNNKYKNVFVSHLLDFRNLPMQISGTFRKEMGRRMIWEMEETEEMEE